ncbi:hypothetical protein CC1G_14924 [Coprinopsis cinerea okayama7|uniref:DUF8021 domain-containing protein n=1 Tax=Coprinopsis cinerea (strain Okayama-7 / 130 / ATCC MYA-4618 / FGSC 9003) TaxID=240176 RepID=D6RNY9_COPC7|nr:hypothetical protein CC1G_14924 [Coprinopsis cinerea okayama7\|eukprot:XP_002910946.1 hypothetical protein CC1G_14924 [Coprinopsis cinerea okayama7\
MSPVRTVSGESAVEAPSNTIEQLQAITADYVNSRLTGSLTSPDLTTATYTENFLPSTIQRSIFASPLRVDYNRSLHDTTSCATYTEMVVTDPRHPYVIGTQIRVDNTTGEVVKVESLITDQGDWLFNATGTKMYAEREDWFTIPVGRRDTREAIQAAADAYLDLWKDKTVVVPWGTPCNRLEGGIYTGNGSPNDSCNVGVPSRIVEMPDRSKAPGENKVMGRPPSGFPGLSSREDLPRTDLTIDLMGSGRVANDPMGSNLPAST